MTGRPARRRAIAGSRSPEVGKQAESIKQMEERNRKRIENAKKTGKFEYDVSKLSAN